MNANEADDEPEAVATRLDLAAFVARMADDLRDHPEQWENTTLPEFLDALSRYLIDVPGYCRNVAPHIDPDRPEWSLFACVLLGASVYE